MDFFLIRNTNHGLPRLEISFLTGLYYLLFFEDSAGQVVCEGDSDRQRVFEVFDFVGYVERQSVVHG
jgi:hypothetical protein